MITFRKGHWYVALLTKTLRVMQFGAVFILGFCLHVAAAGTAQKVTLSAKDMSLVKVFDQIEVQTGFKSVYSKNLLISKRVSIDARAVPLQDFLAQLLEPLALKFVIENNTIFIRNKIAEHLSTPLLSSPPITVRGRIFNEKGEPLAGASIKVKGTNTGTVSGINGEFSLDAEIGQTLVVSYVGYNAQETVVASDKNFFIELERSLESLLNEVVINAGYYKVEERKRTGNIARVTAKDIERQPVTNPLMALQGRVAGLDITPVNGAPGVAPVVKIRGDNSLRGDGGYPLYVVDGVVIDSRPVASASSSFANVGFDPLSTINPGNIESIEVLKDADATSIYGSRGANGVILITTKNAASGNTSVDLSFQKGVGRLTNRVDMLNTQQYLEMRHEAIKNDLSEPGLFDFDINGTWDTTRSTDWQEVLLGGSANINDIQAGISWGNATTSFRLGGSFHNETTIYSNDYGMRRTTASFSLNHQSNSKKFRLSFSANYGADRNKLFNSSDFVNNALLLPPNAPRLYDESGALNWEVASLFGGTFMLSTWTNPLSTLLQTHDANTSSLIASSVISYALAKGLTLKTNIGYTDLHNEEIIKFPIASYYPGDVGVSTTASATFGNNKRNSWIVEPQLDYIKAFNNHSIKVLVGSAFQENTSAYQSTRGTGYTSDIFLNSLSGATTRSIAADNSTEYRYSAVYARAGYDYRNKYIINISGRRDGSSRFGPGNKFGNFASVGAAWIFSDEGFMNFVSFLNFGKIRASYGITGNDQIPDSRYYNTYTTTEFPYQVGVSLYPNALYNPDFGWEKTKKSELGLQLGFLEDRIAVDVSVFKNVSSNLLEDLPLPATTGFNGVLFNLPATIQNSGTEIVFRTINIRNKQFTWSTAVNFTRYRNKVTEFPDLENSSYATRLKIGMSRNVESGLVMSGVDPETGVFQFDDKNKDGTLNADDYEFFTRDRDFYGGINNTFSYKNFELGFLFQFSKQQGLRFNTFMPGSARINQPVEVLGRWRHPGDITNIQKYSTYVLSTEFENAMNGRQGYVDNSFFRLKTLYAAYPLPHGFINRVGLSECKFFVQGQNLLTFTKYIGLDPETGSTTLPPLKMITGGIQIKL